MDDILVRLENNENSIDVIDDAIDEIVKLRKILYMFLAEIEISEISESIVSELQQYSTRHIRKMSP